jgi:hypothetical protein
MSCVKKLVQFDLDPTRLSTDSFAVLTYYVHIETLSTKSPIGRSAATM